MDKKNLNQLAELWKQLATNPHSMALILQIDELANKLGLSVPV